MWGAFNHEAIQPVDAQGNVFVPSVGPMRVLGVRNADLNAQVESQVKRTFRANVGVYATLEAAQPVKIYVTGFVRAPGLYGGLSSDSVLYYLDRAGGIDPDRGSYLEVDVLRGGQARAKVNLYRFLLDGQHRAAATAGRRHHRRAAAQAHGAGGRRGAQPLHLRVCQPASCGRELLALARPRPGATHLSIVRKIGAERRSEYHPLAALGAGRHQDGDEVTFTSDKYPGTILVRIEGAHLGERTLVLPYGAS
jgi:hypothetical protein